jgi:hypothetical protein
MMQALCLMILLATGLLVNVCSALLRCGALARRDGGRAKKRARGADGKAIEGTAAQAVAVTVNRFRPRLSIGGGERSLVESGVLMEFLENEFGCVHLPSCMPALFAAVPLTACSPSDPVLV